MAGSRNDKVSKYPEAETGTYRNASGPKGEKPKCLGTEMLENIVYALMGHVLFIGKYFLQGPYKK